jgi:hypothetical protein
MADPRLEPLVLSDDERRILESWAKRRRTAQGLALRARIVLACAQGGSNLAVQCAECGGSIDVWLPDEGEERNVSCPACGWTTTLTVGTPAEPDATTRLPP